MSKLLDLLYREYTRSRLAEMDAADGFASVWKMANYRRSDDIAREIAEALRTEPTGASALRGVPEAAALISRT